MPLNSLQLKPDSDTQVSFRSPAIATLQGNSGGLTVIGGTGSGDDLTLQSTTNGTKGTLFLDDLVSLRPNYPDDPGSANDIMVFNATFTESAGTGMSGYGFNFAPTYTNSGTFPPLLLSQFGAIKGAGTYNFNATPFYGNLFQLFVAQPAMTIGIASGLVSSWTILSQHLIGTANSITASSSNNMVAFDENSRLGSPDTTGTSGFTTYTGFKFNPRMASGTGATTTITATRGLHVLNTTKSGTGTNTLTTQYGVDIESLTSGITNISIRSTGSQTMRHEGNLILGSASVAPTNILSLDGEAARTIWMEREATANTAGNALTVQAGGATSAATDKNGGTLNLVPGASTGTGRNNVSVQGYTTALATGTSDNTAFDHVVFNGFKALTDNSATSLVSCTIANNTTIGLSIRYWIDVFNGTDVQVETGEVKISATNKAGAIANNVATEISQQAVTAGTLTTAWAISAANPAVISVNANTSLSPSAGYPRIRYVVENFSGQAISIV